MFPCTDLADWRLRERLLIGVKFGAMNGVRIGSGSKMGRRMVFGRAGVLSLYAVAIVVRFANESNRTIRPPGRADRHSFVRVRRLFGIISPP